jgi:hypothetical protein
MATRMPVMLLQTEIRESRVIHRSLKLAQDSKVAWTWICTYLCCLRIESKMGSAGIRLRALHLHTTCVSVTPNCSVTPSPIILTTSDLFTFCIGDRSGCTLHEGSPSGPSPRIELGSRGSRAALHADYQGSTAFGGSTLHTRAHSTGYSSVSYRRWPPRFPNGMAGVRLRPLHL